MQITATFDDFEEMVAFAAKLQQKQKEIPKTKDETKATQMVKDTVETAGTQEKPVIAAEQEEKPVEQNSEEQPAVTYTLVDVRAKLAELQKSGKREQVKKLLAELGAGKLSEVPEEKYALLMEKAGEL